MKNILEITRGLNIPDESVIPYGWDKAKINLTAKDFADKKDGKLVLVTACANAEVAGMGKTSTEIAVNQSLKYLGVKSIACLREPSLGVSFNGKGGATGALKAQVLPADEINTYFTGDIYALTTTINLIAAQIENVIYQGNELNIDPDRIVWSRAIDICDRSLREIWVNADGKLPYETTTKISREFGSKVECEQAQKFLRGYAHKSEFVITVAHELSTIMTLSKDEDDFINRTNKAIVAYTYDNKPVTVADLKMTKSIRQLMHVALMPNIVQCSNGAPAIVQATPFGNISIGCSATIATKLGLKLADITFVENGFASELSCEKHMDLVLPSAGLKPDAIMAVTSCRSLKYQGGHDKNNLSEPNPTAVKVGLENMAAHIKHLRNYSVPLVIAINKFSCDTDEEIKVITDYLDSEHLDYAISEGPLKGETGSVDLAKVLLKVLNNTSIESYEPLYGWEEPIKTKIEKVCKKAYGATAVEYSEEAEKQIEDYTNRDYGSLPIVMCKTPASITENERILGAPKDHTIHIREIRLFAGAGFLVPISGKILLLPGHVKLPRCRDDYTLK